MSQKLKYPPPKFPVDEDGLLQRVFYAVAAACHEQARQQPWWRRIFHACGEEALEMDADGCECLIRHCMLCGRPCEVRICGKHLPEDEDFYHYNREARR